MSLSSVTLADGRVEFAEMNDAVLAHCADEQGLYLGLVPRAEGMVALPAPPPATGLLIYRWDAQAGQWRAEPTLEGAKQAKWDEIKAARAAQETGGFTWDTSTFDSDHVSQGRIQGAVQLALLAADAGQPFAIDWTLADNTVRTLDAAGVIAVGLALGAHVQAAFAHGRDLYAAIEAAADTAAVAAISW